ncbi:unnamed protein product [Arabidopsis lyrata]|nr:unnamed protein product [Arabidopsis lyrata]
MPEAKIEESIGEYRIMDAVLKTGNHQHIGQASTVRRETHGLRVMIGHVAGSGRTEKPMLKVGNVYHKYRQCVEKLMATVTNSRPDQVVVALHDLRVSPGLRTEAFSLPDVVSSQFREELILSPGRGIRHFRTCYQQLASGHVICLFPEVKIYGRDCLSQRIMPLVVGELRRSGNHVSFETMALYLALEYKDSKTDDDSDDDDDEEDKDDDDKSKKSVWWFLDKSVQLNKAPVIDSLCMKLGPNNVDVQKLVTNAVDRRVS